MQFNKQPVTFRNYSGDKDYWKIDSFLVKNYLPGNSDFNWIEPAWEYGFFHPNLDTSILPLIGIWEKEGEIAAVVNPESRLGEAFFQFNPGFRYLCVEMLDYAESRLSASRKDGQKKSLTIYVIDKDSEMITLVKSRGYSRKPEDDRPTMMYRIPQAFPGIDLPEGYHLTSLAEECDLEKVNRVLWRGFNHPGDPPASKRDLEERRRMFDTPTANRDLKIAVKAPNGDFASFSGMFYQAVNKFAYVEPVATDPDYRRLGLGKAAVLEGIRRCGQLGAEVAYVGNDLPIYRSIGFELIFTEQAWLKVLDYPDHSD